MEFDKTIKKFSQILNFSFLCLPIIAEAGVKIQNYVTQPKKSEFNHVIIFGDSLSDTGSGPNKRFVAGGLNFPGYFDVLAYYFSNQKSIYRNFGGTNYAVSATHTYEVHQQVKTYLADNGGHTNNKNLHILWSGGTDTNTAIIFNILKLPFYDFKQDDFKLYDNNKISPTQIIAESAKLLTDNGASYVVVPNIPSAGYAPITSLFHVDVVITLLSAWFPHPLNEQIGLIIRKRYGNFLDTKLRSLPQNGQGISFLREQSINSLQIQFPFIPRAILAGIYDTISNIQNDISRQFNQSVLKALLPLNNKIVYVDTAGMLVELIDHAIDFHTGSIHLTACSLSYRSSDCDEDKNNFFTDRHYIFGDWFHPNWETHIGIAQYIISILNAPEQVASIVKQLNNLSDNSQFYLQSHLATLRPSITPTATKWSIFGGYSGVWDLPNSYVGGSKNTYNNILNLGFNYQLSPNIALGTLLSLSFGKNKPYKDFSYRQNSQNFIFYTQWNDDAQKYWINANIHYGRLHAKNIERSIKLGEIYRIEPAENTNSQTYGTNLRAGWNIWSTHEKMQMGPFVEFSLNHYKLKGFQDQYSHATSMRFQNARYSQINGTIGWYINAPKFEIKGKPIILSTEISYNQNLKKQGFKIASGLKNFPLDFKKEVELTNHNKWITLNSNLHIALNSSTALNTGLGFRINNKKSKNIQLSISLNHKF